ncbi:MAG: tRNA (adenosine(37)-N6)-threonylcarbamoyltransferase complex ATPase subunit type 1 TsaE [Rhodobacteraceae bacterium]|nr:MAG: tRNA (adenosine(37)-N6)-threonylcarbamoyltransferase complex ATPase subunit type 1 TsaE [Paracoccaceae bacterium]
MTLHSLFTDPAISADDTAAFAEALAPMLREGDTILFDGPVGAGKSHFCRALIQARMAQCGGVEDVPSPSFTLVQTYDIGGVEIWHVDLYRLSNPQDMLELGLEDAFGQAICLVEWAERLGDLRPSSALQLTLTPAADPEARGLSLAGSSEWQRRLAPLLEQAAGKTHVR